MVENRLNKRNFRTHRYGLERTQANSQRDEVSGLSPLVGSSEIPRFAGRSWSSQWARQSIAACELELMLQLLAKFLTVTFLKLICMVTFCRSLLS
jgi:hypothetical protein